MHSGNLGVLVLVKAAFESSLEMNWDSFPGKTQFYTLLPKNCGSAQSSTWV